MEGGGRDSGSTTPDTAIDESRKETAKGVVRFSNRLSSRDGHPYYYYHRLESDFFSSLFFFFLSPPADW